MSTSTVSRVLLNESKVSDRAREAVQQAIEETGYVPDLGARGLRSGRTRSIGVSIADLRYPGFTDFVRALGEVVGARQYPLLLADAMWDAEIERFRVRELLARRVDALVALFPQRIESFVAAQHSGVPVLAVPRGFEQIPDSIPRVAIEDADALREMVGELSARGHRSIHYVTRRADWIGRAGPLNAVAADFGIEIHHVEVDPQFVRFVPHEPALRELLPSDLLGAQGATCLFVAQYAIVPVLAQVRREGLRTPHDLSVVVHGHLDWAPVFEPPLDAIETDFTALGELAGHAVLDLLEGRKRPMPLSVRTAYRKRGSVAAPRYAVAV